MCLLKPNDYAIIYFYADFFKLLGIKKILERKKKNLLLCIYLNLRLGQVDTIGRSFFVLV